MKRKFVCIVCPNSCHIDVEFEDGNILALCGVECQKGHEFVERELTHPVRIFTGSVNVRHGNFQTASVKTPHPVPKHLLRRLGQFTHRLTVEAPVVVGQVIARNVLNENIELVATRQVDRNSAEAEA